eukprot:COSAG02_NODE_12241_length_1574_cov_5.391864_2_plen_57_part_00
MQVMQRRATTQLAQQADLGVFWGRLRASGGSMWHARAREKLGGVLSMCGRAKTVCF